MFILTLNCYEYEFLSSIYYINFTYFLSLHSYRYQLTVLHEALSNIYKINGQSLMLGVVLNKYNRTVALESFFDRFFNMFLSPFFLFFLFLLKIFIKCLEIASSFLPIFKFYSFFINTIFF